MDDKQMIGMKHPVIKQIKDYKKNICQNIMIIEDLFILSLRYKYNFKVVKFVYCEEKIFSEEAKKLRDYYLSICKDNYKISEKTFNSLSEKNNSVGMIAVIEHKGLSFKDIKKDDYKFVLVLDGIETPGNLGTIFRTGDAAKVDLIINVDCRTSVYNPKAIQSSRGMSLTVPFINVDYETAQDFLLANNYKILLGEPVQGQDYSEVDYSGNIAIIVGNERFGINPKWYGNKHEKIYIPMHGEMDSLNVGVATSILLYEASKKRTM
ncbi:MAG: TrmH family RNA methyltransferase [Bacilli bacterium]|nr:TrmH family RNA methyltransferase [Bacilli bacterium]